MALSNEAESKNWSIENYRNFSFQELPDKNSKKVYIHGQTGGVRTEFLLDDDFVLTDDEGRYIKTKEVLPREYLLNLTQEQIQNSKNPRKIYLPMPRVVAEFKKLKAIEDKNDIGKYMGKPNTDAKEETRLAPNGKPSNLTNKQYDQVRTPEFKTWFGDWENDPKSASKVIDFNGEPLVVYHGTDVEFTKFTEKYNEYTKGTFFSTEKETASYYGKPKSFFINIKNIKEVSSLIQGAYDLGDITNSKHDGIWNKGTNEIIVGNPNQIKSATDNTGSFNPGNPDINDSIEQDHVDAVHVDAVEALPTPGM